MICACVGSVSTCCGKRSTTFIWFSRPRTTIVPRGGSASHQQPWRALSYPQSRRRLSFRQGMGWKAIGRLKVGVKKGRPRGLQPQRAAPSLTHALNARLTGPICETKRRRSANRGAGPAVPPLGGVGCRVGVGMNYLSSLLMAAPRSQRWRWRGSSIPACYRAALGTVESFPDQRWNLTPAEYSHSR